MNELSIINGYLSGKSCYQLGKLENVCDETIRNVLIRNSVTRRPAAHIPIYSHNTKFFSYVNEKSAYWAGFIAADGNIDPRQSTRLKFGLHSKDRILLERLSNDLSYTGKIRNFESHLNRPHVGLEVGCFKENAKALNDIYNITPTKTLTLQPPNIKKEKFVRAFIVGYIDGDGCLRFRNNGKQFVLDIIGNKPLMEWIREIFNNKFPIVRSSTKLYCYGNAWSYRIVGERALKIARWLKGCPVDKLERKWDRVSL